MATQQTATYFTFGGGLNTQASDLNANPADARDLLNVYVTDAATIRRRPGYDFLLNYGTDTLYWNDTTNYTAKTGNIVDPAPAGTTFKVIKENGDTLNVVIVHVGNYITIYGRDKLPIITSPSGYQQRIEFSPNWSAKAKYAKTRFVQDVNRIYLVNPYLPLLFLAYNEEEGRFDIETEAIFYRDLSDDAEVDDRVTEGGKTYRCIHDHTPTADKKPTSGLQWRDYWVLEGTAPSSGAPAAWATALGNVVAVRTPRTEIDEDGQEYVVSDYANYACIQDHTSASSNNPVTGEFGSTYWALHSQTTSSTVEPTVNYGFLRGARFPLWEDNISYVDATDPDYKSSVVRKEWITPGGFPAGFQAGCMSQGRLWVANVPGERNVIYFSQSISEDFHYTRMYQFADPLNPDDPDVVDSDGGRIKITAAEEIVGMVDYLGGVLVLATNGLWYINGSEGFFKATDYNLKRISDSGCVGPSAWTPVENTVIYGALSGVYGVSLDDISAQPVVTELSTKIRDFWSGIPHRQREASEFVYNPDTFRMYVALNFETPTWWSRRNPYDQSARKQDMLVLHTKLGAWYKHSMGEDPDADKVTIGGLFPVVVNLSDYEPVTVDGVNVTIGAEVVTVPADRATASTITALILMKQNGTGFDWSIGRETGATNQDFSRSTADAASFDSFVESVPQLYSDGGHRKQLPYLYTFFDTVETGFDSGTGLYTNQGGCNYRVNWNWSTNSDAAYYGAAHTAYKPTRFNYVYEDGRLLAYSTVRNRHRVRGTGPALTFRFENDGDKDFHLLGWQSTLIVSPRV